MFESSLILEELIHLLEMRIGPKAEKKTTERVVKRQCVNCSKCVPETEKIRLGRCVRCYTQWERLRASLSVRKRAEELKTLVWNGCILTNQMIREIKRKAQAGKRAS